MVNSIKINKDKILSFKLPIKKEILSNINEICISIKEIVEDDKIIEIFAEYYYKQETHSFKKCYKKESLNPYDLLFIGWSYLSVSDKNAFKVNEEFVKKAKEFLILSIEKGIRSCLPHYLLAKYPLSYKEKLNSTEYLYFALNSCNDVFPEYYSQLYIADKNKIKAIGVIKEGLKKFPTSFILNYHIINYLIEENNFVKALEYMEIIDIKEDEYYGSRFMTDLFYNKFICHVKLKEFEKAEEFIEGNDAFSKSEIQLLKGFLCYHQFDFENSSNFFLDYIQMDLNECYGFCGYYFLLDCYLKLKKYNFLDDILNAIPDGNIDYIDYGLNIEFLEIAENCLEEIIKLDIDELIIARAEGLLASVILDERLPDFNEEIKRVLTKKENNLLLKAEVLIEHAINFYPVNQFFLTTYSNILFLKEQFDEAMTINLKILEVGTEYLGYTDVSLKNCSEKFIDDYKNILEKTFPEKKIPKSYMDYQFSYDINTIFNLRKYNVVADLYFYLKKDIDLNDSDNLFEIAYSLKEKKYINDSEFIYSKLIDIEPNNTSALNNLAIIFEDIGRLDKAIELIKKAKALSQDDMIIINNFNRITGKKNIEKGSKIKINHESKQKQKLTFDLENSKIIYGNRFCSIPIGTYEYYLCKVVFEQPLGFKILEEDVSEALDRAILKERNRTIYDTVIRINKKVEKDIGLKKLLINKNSRIWVRED